MEPLPRACALLLLASPILGQAPFPPKKVDREVSRHIRFLELPSKKAAAVTQLLALHQRSVPELTRALADPRIEIVRTVGHILRHLGAASRPALPTLRKMAAEPDRERAALARWAMARIRSSGASGTTLVADYNEKKIIEFDANGKRTLELAAGQAWNAERLPNGNFLVADYGGRKVFELNRKGERVWALGATLSPMDATRLPNGNTLVTDLGKQRVVEFSPKGKEVWSYACPSAYDADRLPNGNTLIVSFSKKHLIEVDPKGKIVWHLKDHQALSAERLPNGNTLIAAYTKRRVYEVDPKGKKVWDVGLGFSPDSVHRLPNGNTLVGGSGKVLEYTPKGEQVRRLKVGRAASVDVY